MNNTEQAIAKFKSSPSPVVFTPDEYAAFCSFYGAVQPNNYDEPFMGKVIEVREREFAVEEPVLDEGEYELEVGSTFIAPDVSEETILPPPVEEFALEDLPPTEEEENEVLEEDPYA